MLSFLITTPPTAKDPRYHDYLKYGIRGSYIAQNQVALKDFISDFSFAPTSTQQLNLSGGAVSSGLQWINRQVKHLAEMNEPTVEAERTLDFLIDIAPMTYRKKGFIDEAETYEESSKRMTSKRVGGMHTISHICNCISQVPGAIGTSRDPVPW